MSLRGSALLVILLTAAAPLRAQTDGYPVRPLRFVVPLAPGGGADMVARLVAERLSRNLNQPVLVDNRAGGGTVIGADLAAKSAPDGYTLLLGTATTHAINSSLVKKLPYDPVRDFAPISLIAVLPQIIVAHPSLPASTLPELIALARRRPGEIFYASTGNGSANQLGAEMLKRVARLNMTHVPYKGAGPAIADLLAGQTQFMFTTIPPALPHVKTGRLKALAVAHSKRSVLLPQLPTTAESGAPGVEASSWNGVLTRAGTIPAIVSRLHSELAAIMNQNDLRDRFAAAGVETTSNTPEAFAQFIASETARYAQVIAASGARID